ncbi:hypothetical protein [Xanthomonas medicagonis]|uniref:hypothetical protein n=1 Tax=Xanthomonas medicagonis TaxID=3160841 RepID=UPI00351275EC
MRVLKSFKMINLVSLTVLVLSASLLAAFLAPILAPPVDDGYISACAPSTGIKIPAFIHVISMSVIVSLLLASVVIRVKAATIGNKFTVWTSTISSVFMLINALFYIVCVWAPFD